MGYQVLYRTYRPAAFKEVVGQDYIIKTLKNAIKHGKIAHAYLFAGPRGTGKTTIAKLFAKAINCLNFNEEACDECESCKAFLNNNHPDIIELDAASNNGVDDIRQIIEQVPYAPMLGKYKVYIIDEVHMLSSQAFNALLKTLEEPPAHVIFILATTDPQKIIPTVLSRCQRYNFSKISNLHMKKKMIEILNKEAISFDEKALDEIALLAEGGMRDALSILEQVLAYNNEGVYLEDVSRIFGLSSSEEKVNLLKTIHNNNISEAICKLRDMYQSGIDSKRLAIDLLEIIKEALIYSDNADEKLLNKINKIQAMEILENSNIPALLNDINCLQEIIINNKGNQNFLSYLELAFIKMANDNTFSQKQIPRTKTEIRKEISSPTKTIEEKTIIKEVNKTESEPNDFIKYLASLLLTASKNEKINDSVIFNRLELYKFEADKRKYYELLNGTEIFASGKDAIVVIANRTQVNNLNSPEIKEDIYKFLVDEFGIDKVIFAIEKESREELINTYRKLKEYNHHPGEVIKPKIIKERTKEEKLKELFGDITVEE